MKVMNSEGLGPRELQVTNLAWSQDGELVSTHGSLVTAQCTILGAVLGRGFSTCDVSLWKNQSGGVIEMD